MENTKNRRRKYDRFDTELKVHFQVKYDFKTKVKFQVVEGIRKDSSAQKYSGVCKNISAEGLSFISHKRTRKGDIVMLEVYAPNAKKPVKMEGEIRWCRKLPERTEGRDVFRAGVLLILVNSKSVVASIYFDEEYQIIWSEVLSCVFGNFKFSTKQLKRRIMRKNKA